MSALRPKTHKIKGNTLPEYVLVGGLVLLVSLGGLALLGNSLQGSFHNFEQSLKPELASQKFHPIPSSNQAAKYSAIGNLSFTTRSGTTFQLQNYPQDMRVAITTIGANGTTEIILANMVNLTQQLLKSGEITQEQANLLQAMSNQGHEIAKVEALLEAARTNSPTRNTPITYNGKISTINDLAQSIGTWEDGRSPSDSRIQLFRELQSKAAAQGALDDPAVKQVVTLMSDQIIALANGVESGINMMINHQVPLEKYELYAITGIETETPVKNSLLDIASKTTHKNSATICTVGGNNDSGTACMP